MAVGFLVRCGIVAGAVVYTRKVGIWGSTAEAEQIYKDAKEQLSPYVEKATKSLPFELPQMPRTGEMRYLAKHYYNEAVKSTFRFVHMLPCYAGRGLKSIKDKFDEFSQPPVPTKEEAKAKAAATATAAATTK